MGLKVSLLPAKYRWKIFINLEIVFNCRNYLDKILALKSYLIRYWNQYDLALVKGLKKVTLFQIKSLNLKLNKYWKQVKLLLWNQFVQFNENKDYHHPCFYHFICKHWRFFLFLSYFVCFSVYRNSICLIGHSSNHQL